MNVILFANKNHYAFGSYLEQLMNIVSEGNKVVKQQHLLVNITILIGQLVTFIQNAINLQTHV